MPERNAPLVITRIDERDAGHVAARKTDEPKRLMQAFVECMK